MSRKNRTPRPVSQQAQDNIAKVKNRAAGDLPHLQKVFPEARPNHSKSLEFQARRAGYHDWNGYEAALAKGTAQPPEGSLTHLDKIGLGVFFNLLFPVLREADDDTPLFRTLSLSGDETLDAIYYWPICAERPRVLALSDEGMKLSAEFEKDAITVIRVDNDRASHYLISDIAKCFGFESPIDSSIDDETDAACSVDDFIAGIEAIVEFNPEIDHVQVPMSVWEDKSGEARLVAQMGEVIDVVNEINGQVVLITREYAAFQTEQGQTDAWGDFDDRPCLSLAEVVRRTEKMAKRIRKDFKDGDIPVEAAVITTRLDHPGENRTYHLPLARLLVNGSHIQVNTTLFDEENYGVLSAACEQASSQTP